MATENDDDYGEWLKHRRSLTSDENLVNQIMSAIENPAVSVNVSSSRQRLNFAIDRVGPILVLTAASLVFAVRIASLVGNLVFPTQCFPEFAVDQRIEEPSNGHRNVTRS